jgi:hypothetical protein
MLRELVRKILINEVFDNLLMEGPEEIQKIKDTYYPDLKLKQGVIDSIYNALKANQVLKKSYINWIFILLKNRVPRVIEDLDTIAKNLKVFNAKSSQIAADGVPTTLYKQNGDLVYSKQQDLYDVVAKYAKTDEGGEKNLIKKGEYLVSKGQAKKIYEDSDYVVFTPDTYEASKELACLTQWCTRFPNMYENYSSQGPLYIILNKSTLGTQDKNRMIQFHIPSKQFKDVNDREVPNRREFMNNLKGLFNTMFPSAVKEFQLVQDGKKDKDDLTASAKESRYIMPSEYWDELDIPCDEIQEKIASELGVDCKDVEEGDNGYLVDDKQYRVETVEDATEYAIDSMVNSGMEDQWFMDWILSDYSWTDVFVKENIDVSREVENEFGDDWKNVYETFKSDLEENNEYSEEEIEEGDFVSDITYNMFIDALESYRGDNPVKYYVDEMGMRISNLNFVDLDEAAKKYFEDCYDDCLGNWVSSYDGRAYYFDIDGVEHIMYRTD